MTDKEVAARLGLSNAGKLQMVLLGDALYRRVDGHWEAYAEPELPLASAI